MKAALALSAALLLQGASPALAQPTPARGSEIQSLCRARGWKQIRVVELMTSTDNGGEMQVFSSGASRKIRVRIGLSTSIVQADYIFRSKKLVLVDITRTRFSLGEDGIDFTKPSFVENGRYGFRDGRVISRVTRERDIGGPWKYGVATEDKMDARLEVANARFYLKVAASGQKRVDVESWVRRAR